MTMASAAISDRRHRRPGHMPLCLFAADPDIAAPGFLVPVLTGSPNELAEQCLDWGYDGFEYMPDPERVPDPEPFTAAVRRTGAVLPMINTGRLVRQGMTLFQADPRAERKAVHAFKQIIEFAGALGAKVGLGIARGPVIADLTPDEMDRYAEDLFRELAAHAERAGTTVLLEQAEIQVTHFIRTMEEVTHWVDRIGRPGFGLMLDTAQLSETEPSLAEGIRVACGRAQHIHLFDRGRRPPGLLKEGHDWSTVFRTLADENYRGAASVALSMDGDRAEAARHTARFLRTLRDAEWSDQADFRGCFR